MFHFAVAVANFVKNETKSIQKERGKDKAGSRTKKSGKHVAFRRSTQSYRDYTQPVGLGRPAILQAPLPGPEGKSSYTSFSL